MVKHFTLEQLAKITHSKLIGDPTHMIQGVDDIKTAKEVDASFLSNPKYKEALQTTQAGVICVHSDFPIISGKNYLLHHNPSEAFQIIAEAVLDIQDSSFEGIHPSAVIDPSATIEEGVSIGPYCVVDRDVTIQSGTSLVAQVYVGPSTEIGKDCLFYPGVIIRERCQIGHRVICQPGAIIGSCGYGYVTNQDGRHIKLKQLGIVIIEDDVEIGANTTIDRARFKSTKISKGTKIDNLVQIGHNVQIGEHNLIVSQTGIAGSSKTGSHVMMGGQVGILGHVEIANGVMIATRSGISKNIKEKGTYGGSPAIPLNEYNKQQVYLRKIESYANRIKALEKELDQIKAMLPSTV